MYTNTGRTAATVVAVAVAVTLLGLPAWAADASISPGPTPAATASAPASEAPTQAPTPVESSAVTPAQTSVPTAPEPAPTPTPEPVVTAPAAPQPGPATAPAAAATFRGVTVPVPDGWAVVDLEKDPSACVRLDVRAVYLGAQGPAPRCPSRIVGRTSTLQLQTAPAELPFGTVTLTPGSAFTPTPEQRVAGEVTGIVDGTDVLVTGTFVDGDATALATALAGLVSTPSAAGSAAARSALAGTVAALAATPLDRSFTWHHGRGFDACTAPPLSSMQAWLASPYRSIGIYVGGVARGCQQPNLTSSWLRSVAAMGWKAQPIYVGLQAPCSSYTNRITPGLEWAQGREAALDAIARAQALGLGGGSDIYYDMESYTRGTECSGSVRAYLSSWTQTLRAGGYSSGVYSSAATGIADLAIGAGQPGFVAPDKIWIARWNGTGSIYGHTTWVADNQWAPYSRIHQYNGGHNETHGGVTINIDNNLLDTDPNRGSPVGQLESTATAPSSVTASGWALDPDTAGPILVQMYVDGAPVSMAWASGSRPDVGQAFPAAGDNHGYRVTGTVSPGRHSVCVFAVNSGPGTSTGLGCRTVDVPTSNPFGRVDAVSGTPGTVTARGWAIDPDTAGPIIVQMYLDDGTSVMGWANQTRGDIGAAFPSAGPDHGYTLTLPAAAGRRTACVFAVNTGAGATTSLGCFAVDVPSSDPFGQLDAVSAAGGVITASGWTIDPDTASPIIVQMFVDGSSYAMGWANAPRADIGAAFPAAGPNHGFSLRLAASPGLHSVCIYAVNTGAGASAALGCRTVRV